MAEKWVLSWGIASKKNKLNQSQGEDKHLDSLKACKDEVVRLKKHYSNLGYVLWFANAKCSDERSELNLHR